MSLTVSANLNKSFRNLVKQIDDANKDIVGKTIINTHNAILNESPVDTGIYKASNFVKEDRADGNVADNPNELSNRISEARVIVPEIKNGKKYIFYNNLPYALKLEAGHSKQALEGIYAPAADSIIKFIKKNSKAYKKIRFKAIK